MKFAKKLLALLLCLTLLATLCATAFAAGEEASTDRINYKYVDTDGQSIEGAEDGFYPLTEALVLDENTVHPSIEGYTYQKATLGGETLQKLSITPATEEVPAVITAVIGDGEGTEKALTGGETVLFVYEKNHEHDFGEGEVTKEPTCVEPGVRTFTCACGETKTEEIPALNHDWGEVSYTWSEDNKSCTASRTCSRGCTETETVTAAETVNKQASCTEVGEKTLTASFTNEAFAQQTKTVEIEKLPHDFNEGHCKVCDALDPNFKPAYSDNTRGRASWGTDYVCKSTAAYKDFQYVTVDGQELGKEWYSVKEGSTIVTIKGDYIRKMKVGDHTIAIVSSTGTASGTVNVSEKPKTGDENGLSLWIGLMTVSALCGGLVIAYAHRKIRTK